MCVWRMPCFRAWMAPCMHGGHTTNEACPPPPSQRQAGKEEGGRGEGGRLGAGGGRIERNLCHLDLVNVPVPSVLRSRWRTRSSHVGKKDTSQNGSKRIFLWFILSTQKICCDL